jgi:hypothetical protein
MVDGGLDFAELLVKLSEEGVFLSLALSKLFLNLSDAFLEELEFVVELGEIWL